MRSRRRCSDRRRSKKCCAWRTSSLMPKFVYVSVDDTGEEVKGFATAESEEVLADQLRREGRYLVRADLGSEGASLSEIRILERINKRDVIFFTQQLATVMATGIAIVEGLQDIEEQMKKAAMRRVVAALRRDIESGESLSAALAKHPKAFTDLYVNIVRSGEA